MKRVVCSGGGQDDHFSTRPHHGLTTAACSVAEFADLLAVHVVRLDLGRAEVRFASTVVVSGTTDVVSRWLSGDEAWTHDDIARSIERLGVTLATL